MKPASSDLFHTGIQSNIIIYPTISAKTVIPTSFQHIRLFQLQQTPGCPLPTVMPYLLLTFTITQIRPCNNLIIGWITYTTAYKTYITVQEQYLWRRLLQMQPSGSYYNNTTTYRAQTLTSPTGQRSIIPPNPNYFNSRI